MNDWYDKTNAQLFYAQQLLKAYQASLLSDSAGSSAALLNAASLSIKEAWLCWINELATMLGVKNSTFTSAEQLFEHDIARLPDVQGLKSLKETPDSGLYLLVQRSEEIGYAVNSGPQSRAGINRDPLALQSLDEPEQSESKLLSQQLDSFKAYIQGVRAQQVEW